MTEQLTWDAIPSGWAPLSGIAEDAVRLVLALVEDASSSARAFVAQAFHDPSSSPLTFCPSPTPDRFTSDDLLAAALDGRRLTRAGVVRVLGPGPHATEVRRALRALPSGELYLVGADGLAAMEALHHAVRLAVGDECSSVVGLICARKRPDLFPLFSTSARAKLGLASASGRRADWLVARQLVGNREVVRALDELLTELAGAARVTWRDEPGRGSRLQELSLVLGVLAGPPGPRWRVEAATLTR